MAEPLQHIRVATSRWNLPAGSEILSTRTLTDTTGCCGVTSPCLGEITIPSLLYVTAYAVDGGDAYASDCAPDEPAATRRFWLRTFAIRWDDDEEAWIGTTGTMDVAEGNYGVSLSLFLSLGSEEEEPLDCLGRLTGTLNSNDASEVIGDVMDPGAILDAEESTLDPVYLRFTTEDDTCIGLYIVTE